MEEWIGILFLWILWGFIALIFFKMIFDAVKLIRKLPGLSKILPSIPLVVMIYIVFKIVADTRIDPTSHNLWPLEIIIITLGGLLYLFILTMISNFIKRKI